jgi:hypothetical protein
MKTWNLDTFKSLIGETVLAKELEGESQCELKISEVNESKSLGEGWEAFSVILTSDVELGQGSVDVSHSEYGDTTVFLNPKSINEHEAIFSYQV